MDETEQILNEAAEILMGLDGPEIDGIIDAIEWAKQVARGES